VPNACIHTHTTVADVVAAAAVAAAAAAVNTRLIRIKEK